VRSGNKMAEIRLGIIGTGGIVGMLHIPAYLKMPEIEIVGLADPNPAGIAAAKEPNPLLADVPEYADHRELLDKEKPDAVLVASPHAFHSPQMIDAMDAGCHIQTEKPAGTGPAAVQAVIDKRDETGKIVVVSYNRRFLPIYQGIVNSLRAGEIGDVHGISLLHTENWFTRNSVTWRTVRDMAGGGFIIDTGAHTLDFIHHAMGQKTAKLTARIDRMGTEVDINAAVSFEFEGGAIGSVFTTGHGPKIGGGLWEDISFFGEKGAIMLRSMGDSGFGNPTVYRNDYETGKTTSEEGGDGMMEPYVAGPGKALVDEILGRPNVEFATLEDALRVHEFVDAVYRSADGGGNEVSV
jgi:predicted dehydrogenase